MHEGPYTPVRYSRCSRLRAMTTTKGHHSPQTSLGKGLMVRACRLRSVIGHRRSCPTDNKHMRKEELQVYFWSSKTKDAMQAGTTDIQWPNRDTAGSSEPTSRHAARTEKLSSRDPAALTPVYQLHHSNLSSPYCLTVPRLSPFTSPTKSADPR